MWQKNSGRKDINGLQNWFTAYLLAAVKREKAAYRRRKWKREKAEVSTDFQDDDSPLSVLPDMLEDLPLQMQIVSDKKRRTFPPMVR